jgi:CRP/FNR family transcriptional regulator, cyclic AMP receptor protein
MTTNSELMSTVLMFARVPQKTIDRLAAIATERHYVEGSDIVTEGDSGIALYVIAEGTAAVVHAGEATPRATLKKGDSFGEMAIVDGRPRTATIRATSAVTCLALPRWDFIAEVRNDDTLAMELIGRMSARIRELERMVQELEAHGEELSHVEGV